MLPSTPSCPVLASWTSISLITPTTPVMFVDVLGGGGALGFLPGQRDPAVGDLEMDVIGAGQVRNRATEDDRADLVHRHGYERGMVDAGIVPRAADT